MQHIAGRGLSQRQRLSEARRGQDGRKHGNQPEMNGHRRPFSQDPEQRGELLRRLVCPFWFSSSGVWRSGQNANVHVIVLTR
eukprot:scaffold161318_cov34-Tisochrysis_lutea.AAC.5